MYRPTAKYLFFLLALFSLPMFVLAQAPNKFPFKKQDMPFNATAVERPIDHDCVREGTGQGDAQQTQNRAKNDFGEHGTPVAISITDFDLLERAAERAKKCAANHLTTCQKLVLTNVGDQLLPADRTQLKNIAKTAAGAPVGEGTLVVLEAKVLHAKYSNSKFDIHGVKNGKPDRSQGESVNCKGVPDLNASSEIDRNDIHVVLAAPGVMSECLSVTAEISPHFRPEAWRHFHNQRPNQLGEDVNKVVKGVDLTKFKAVRITGPLFYDASHTPCTPGHSASPPRRSIWEIHPVYKLDVQTAGGQWVSFEEFMKTH